MLHSVHQLVSKFVCLLHVVYNKFFSVILQAKFLKQLVYCMFIILYELVKFGL